MLVASEGIDPEAGLCAFYLGLVISTKELADAATLSVRSSFTASERLGSSPVRLAIRSGLIRWALAPEG